MENQTNLDKGREGVQNPGNFADIICTWPQISVNQGCTTTRITWYVISISVYPMAAVLVGYAAVCSPRLRPGTCQVLLSTSGSSPSLNLVSAESLRVSIDTKVELAVFLQAQLEVAVRMPRLEMFRPECSAYCCL